MAKKTRHDLISAKERTINLYNFGTINIDARQNNSRTSKHENKGCTITPRENGGTVDCLQISKSESVTSVSEIIELLTRQY